MRPRVPGLVLLLLALTARSLHCRGSVRLQSYFHRPGEAVSTPARDPKLTLSGMTVGYRAYVALMDSVQRRSKLPNFALSENKGVTFSPAFLTLNARVSRSTTALARLRVAT